MLLAPITRPVASNMALAKCLLSVSERGVFRINPKHFSKPSLNRLIKATVFRSVMRCHFCNQEYNDAIFPPEYCRILFRFRILPANPVNFGISFRRFRQHNIKSMKFLWLVWPCLISQSLFSQTLQFHYDFRHTLDPQHNVKNYPGLYFQYFKNQDSGKSLIKPGSFLLKTQADFTGQHHNIGQCYLQVSQSFRMWKPHIYADFQYSGGLGVVEPKQYGYYIVNSFGAGVNYPFSVGKSYFAAVAHYTYTAYEKPSNDIMFTLYWWRGLWNYKASFSGDFSIWTQNKDLGDSTTIDLSGKRFYFFAEPQFWFHINNAFSIGTKINMYYHVLTTDNRFQVYPTLGIEYKI
jgi:Domain of unknown function (DUF5020)